ncbi:MAG: glutamate--tRNA ligase [Anaerosomatales bacterium]|nr:glutamate--tRNA ligase [Anaerosomatales bacterium]
MSQPVRVRFAPSPTGHLHIGGARTAVYNWAFARRHGGVFVLRIEDTDPERSTEENTQAILRSLAWLGIDHDEGPDVGGPYGPYRQTERAALYAEALERLKERDAVYPCFCTPEELERKREEARARGGFAGYDRTCRALAPEEAERRISEGRPHAWRLKVPLHRGDVVFDDLVRGTMTFPISAIDDLIVVRSDGTPTYNFAVAVDDATMRISHVIRGDDHISNTPKQLLIYEALGYEPPAFAHLSMIWGPDGKRLSKRHGATSVEAYREMGYLPEALLNYLALLGWSLDGETTVIDRQTLIENFSLERVSRNPAIFDAEKLEWLNGVYIRALSPEAFTDRMVPLLENAGLLGPEDAAQRRGWLLELAPLVSERIKRLDEVVPMVRFLFVDAVEIDEKSREAVLAKPGARESLEAAAEALEGLGDWTSGTIEAALRALPERLGAKPKAVFQAVRVAVTGSTVSPPLFESIALLGKERTLSRLERALPLAG